eukprot:SAG25_NODE_553_length_6984_cov_153.629339_7_plen_97_part_00
MHTLFGLFETVVAIDVVCHTIVESIDVLGDASSSSLHSHFLLLHARVRVFLSELEESWRNCSRLRNRHYVDGPTGFSKRIASRLGGEVLVNFGSRV